jgi:predicted acetylornithine/succinylornithine family transaminase
MDTKKIIKEYEEFVAPTYTRLPIVLTKAKGASVWDSDGKKYLDFFPGWAVSGLGHCHPLVVKAIKEQAARILHVSNNYYNLLQAELAKTIVKNSFDGKVFFSNSGAEANEAAIKLARRYFRLIKGQDKFEIISMENSFHGRTLATITMTGQTKYQEGFAPLPEGFRYVPFNNFEVLKAAVNDKTAAIIIELVQGEGGINVADKDYVWNVRNLCNQRDILLIIDEVQTGMARTGAMFAFKLFDIAPDIMTLAKSLGGGMPVGATVIARRYADVLQPGTHASTFGGSPIVCAAALAVFEAIKKEKLLNNVKEAGGYLAGLLNALKDKYGFIKQVRGLGLMLGVELNMEGKDIVQKCIDKGLLINCTHQKVLRIMPPLDVTKNQIDKAIGILDEVFHKISAC